MKLKRCQIYQFGTLKDRDYRFSDGFTLIAGKNESGKTTLHTGMAALLFGMERGRGRAAANDLYKTYQPWTEPSTYGGALEWESGEGRVHIERDFAKTPPRAYATVTRDGSTRELKNAEQPFPKPLSPYLFFNTLSFKQMGSGVEGGMADELRSHIINLQGSGSEKLDVAAALTSLRNRRKELQKSLREDADTESAVLEKELRTLENDTFLQEPDVWSETQDVLKQREASARLLYEDRRQMGRELSDRQQTLKELGIENREQVQEDRDRVQVIEDQMKLYEESYAPGMPSAGKLRLLSYLSMAAMLFFAWRILMSANDAKYWLTAVWAVLLFLSMLVSTRFSRRLDAQDAQKHNQKILKELLSGYMPEHEALGTQAEAAELGAYLDRILQYFDYIDERSEEYRDKTETLAELLSEQESLSRRLEAQMSAKVRREQWEAQLRSLMDRLELLKPVTAENDRLREEIAALDLAYSTLSGLAADVYSDFGAPLTETASGLFREITDGRYEGVRISNKLEIYAVQNHQLVAPSALSGGTIEQLYFAFRMAVIRLLWPDEPMPLFFDDSFAFYDSERLASLLKWLHKNYEGQIFLFTCHEREEALLNEAGIPYSRIDL